MKLGGKYKLIGKKKYATIEYPIEKVAEIFTKALSKGNRESRLQGSVNQKTGLYKIYYKISDKKGDYYENYCLLAELKAIDDNTTQIQYCFVYDRVINYYTKALSLICFAVSLAAAAVAFFGLGIKNVFLYIVLLIISAFGIVSLFAYKEKQSDAEPIVGEFEQLLMNTFSDSEDSDAQDVETSGEE